MEKNCPEKVSRSPSGVKTLASVCMRKHLPPFSKPRADNSAGACSELTRLG